jgi:uncharacterized protein
MAAVEHRAAVELRVASGRRLEGYAAVFGSPATIGNFRETILPGAFRASLATNGDILALVDHSPERLLARTASGTLRLAEDARGLAFAIDVPDTSLGRDVLAMAERGDLGGASIGFRVKDEAWPSRDRRELRAVDLVEVSVVHAFPAYAATSVTARSRQSALVDVRRRRAWLAAL